MELSKYQHIKIKGFYGKWSAYDYYADNEIGELIFLKNDDLGDKAVTLACRVVGESGLELVCTFKDESQSFCDTVKQAAHSNY